MTSEHRSILDKLVDLSNGLSPDSPHTVRKAFLAGWRDAVARFRARLDTPAGATLLADVRTATSRPPAAAPGGFGTALSTERGLFKKYRLRHPFVGRHTATVFRSAGRLGLAAPPADALADAAALGNRVEQLVASAVEAVVAGRRQSDRGRALREAPAVLRAQYFLLGLATLVINLYEADPDLRPVSLAFGGRLSALAASEPFRRVG
jgi:hypothetical protein